MVFHREAGHSGTRAGAHLVTAPTVLVDCIVRADAEVTSGGDMVQLREYANHLLGRGVDMREVPFHPAMQLRPGAIVHIFNVDRPFDFVIACRIARGHRRLVSPIHHNLDRVRAMRAAERGRGVRSVVSRLMPELPREWIGTTVRALRRSRAPRPMLLTAGAAIRTLPSLARIWRRVGVELDRADAVALLALGEGRDLEALTGWHGRNAVLVPNGRPEDVDVADRRDWVDRDASILVVGRIEPRKRQLELARTADDMGIPLTFIGQRSAAGDAYTLEFDHLAATSSFVTYAGPVSRDEVLRRMGDARVLLNGSWVEVQSLVDLEAACMGCAVVATDVGHSREWLGNAITVVPGGELRELVAASQRVAADPNHAPPEIGYDWTWERASDELYEVYVRE